MRKILILALCGLFCGWSVENASAADDVYVDLSVLDEIGSGSAPSAYARPEPLFPIIKNTPQFPVVKKKPVQAAVKKKPVKKKKAKAKPVEKEDKITLPEKPAKTVEEKIVEPEAAKAPAPIPAPEASKPAEPVAEPVKTTVDLTSAPAKREAVAEVLSESKEEKAPFKTEEVKPAEKISPAPVVPVKTETVENAPVAESVPAAAEEKVEPLIPVAGSNTSKAVDVEKLKREIVFAEGSDELDELSKEKIDAIIASFENAKTNKIAIMAYNYDNGQDVFRKKRQSLNRAIEIRSYLLGKGYKNFSIKVINITNDAARGNVVEIDEIK